MVPRIEETGEGRSELRENNDRLWVQGSGF